jgi:hypothetical protein
LTNDTVLTQLTVPIEVAVARSDRHWTWENLETLSGEGGIRTRGGVTPTQHFQCCTFGRSVTSPLVRAMHSRLPAAGAADRMVHAAAHFF